MSIIQIQLLVNQINWTKKQTLLKRNVNFVRPNLEIQLPKQFVVHILCQTVVSTIVQV